MMTGTKFSFTSYVPEQLIQECRVTTLERMMVDSFRAQMRRQLHEAKAEQARGGSFDTR
jgi:hypothetical protein